MTLACTIDRVAQRAGTSWIDARRIIGLRVANPLMDTFEISQRTGIPEYVVESVIHHWRADRRSLAA